MVEVPKPQGFGEPRAKASLAGRVEGRQVPILLRGPFDSLLAKLGVRSWFQHLILFGASTIREKKSRMASSAVERPKKFVSFLNGLKRTTPSSIEEDFLLSQILQRVDPDVSHPHFKMHMRAGGISG